MSDHSESGTVRPLTPRDTGEINRILSENYPWTEYEAKFEFEFETASVDTQDEVFVYEEDGVVVGVVWGIPEGTFGRSGYVRLVGVDEGYRGEGVGTALMDRIERALFEGSEDIFLLVSKFNEVAVAFYQDRGYTHVGTLEDYVEDGIDEYLLQKHH